METGPEEQAHPVLASEQPHHQDQARDVDDDTPDPELDLDVKDRSDPIEPWMDKD